MDEFLKEQADANWFDGLGRKTADVPRVWQGNKAAAAAAERAAGTCCHSSERSIKLSVAC
jgi:hypothetical protein